MSRWPLLILLAFAACSPTAEAPGESPSPRLSTSPSVSPSPSFAGYRSVEIASGLDYPLALTPAGDGRLFFAEAKSGRIRLWTPSGLKPSPVATIPVAKEGEFGLVGLALDPQFAANSRMYAYFTVPDARGKSAGNRVVRLVIAQESAQIEQTIVGDIPSSVDKHVAGRLAFGPDGFLYVAVGDTQRPDSAQDSGSLTGKILRVDTDGNAPGDNPFPGSRVWALGFRNPYGLAFDPLSKKLFAVENGPARFDEVNLIQRGANYGHPIVSGPSSGRFTDPIWHSGDDSHGMSGISVVRNSPIPQVNDRLLFCTFDNGRLHSIPLDPEGNGGSESVIEGVDCNLDVAGGPDGVIYIATGSSIFKLDPA